MKHKVVFHIIAWLCVAEFLFAQRHHATPNASLILTEVLSGNKVAFRVYAPEANSVKLHSNDKWDQKVEFKKDSNGVWEGYWTDVLPGAYRYRFIVDGVNVYDPKAPLARETTAILIVSSDDDFFAMKEDVSHGAISQRYY